MATIYALKPAFRNLLRPTAHALARAGATPNLLTTLGIGISIGAGAAIAIHPTERWPLLLLPAILFIRMALNAMDGMLARERDMATRLGAWLNEVGDVVSDAVMYLPLALVVPTAPVIAFTGLAAATEVVGATRATRRYDGPMGKSDRAVLVSLVAFIPAAATVLLTAGILLELLTLRNRGHS